MHSIAFTSSRKGFRRPGSRGLSLVEVIVTIAVLGILASIAYSGLGNIGDRSRDSIATNLVETLNKATRNFSYAQWEMSYPANAGSTADEQAVLRSLQWKEPAGGAYEKELSHKGPFMRPDWNPASSSQEDDWRIQWTGSSWRLLSRGDQGSGLLVDFDGADLGTPYVHPPNFSPVGR